MGNDRLAKNASVLVLLIAVTLTPGTASAGGRIYPGWNENDSWLGSSGIPAAYPFPGAIANQPDLPWCYTFPFQAAFQFPAAQASQPGSEVGYLWTDPTYGLLGGRPYLYHR
jgi:hypothetical protein